MNPNDFMGYPQGQQPQQPMQMPNFNPSMPMQPNFGKGLPNFNPQNMQMNRQNTMNQYQAMQFPGMPNPMNQMQPGAMTNPMPPAMNQNMMKQHNMMQPTGASFGFPAPNNRHRSSLTGMQFNNTSMFPQMIPTQSGTQPPTITLQSQSSSQPKKKRSSSQVNNMNNTSNANANSNVASANSSQSIQLQPSSSIENLAGSVNSNASISTPISDTASEKVGSSGSRGSKSGSGSSSQKHSSMMSTQASMNNMSGIGSIGSMNNITQMNSMNNLNMGMSGMSSMGNMGNLSQIGSLSSMNNMASMNMNMNMGMNMGMPMNGMNMSNMNGMNVMNGMNMNGMNVSMNQMGLNSMSSMGNLSGMNSMGAGLSGINSMGSMSGIGNMGNMSSMSSMAGMPSSAANPAVASQSSAASTSNPSSLQQAVVSQSSTSNQQSNQSNPPQNQPQVPNSVPNPSNQPPNQQRTQQQTINVPPQIQNQTAVQQMSLMVGPGGISPEITRMKNLLEKMSKEKADIFFALFEVHQAKKRLDKIKYFINYVINNFHPNWVLFTINFLDQINQSPLATTPAASSAVNGSSNPSLAQPSSSVAPVPPPNTTLNVNIGLNIYQKFKEPPLSPIFSRVKNFKPMFKNLVLNQNCLTFSPENCKKYIVIGSFLSSTERIEPEKDSVSVFCDTTEILPLNFGGNESYYVLFPEGEKVPQQFQVRVTSQSKAFPPSFLTWFVCQVVEKRNAYEILDSLLTAVLPQNVQKEKIQIARTPMCKGCGFYAIHVIEDILNKGFAFCPTCHANIVLNDLIFDTKVTGTPQQINFKIEENKDMELGRNACSDALTSLMKPSHTEQNWEFNIFDKPGLPKKEYIESKYTNTNEFRKEISQFNDHSFA